VADQVAGGDRRIIDVMIESHLHEGRQDLIPDQPLKPGVSITDACISMTQTAPALGRLADTVKARRQATA
jgi:3-deoxy-7-phosphoheptulonate synthase